MKKRVLSMLLAFALCFTAFAGFAAEEGPADGGRIETNVDRLDNVLTKLATPGQQDKVKGIAPVTVDPAKEPWSTIIEKVLNPTVLETNLDVDIKELTVRPYYFLRHLEERVGGDPEFSAEEYPLISELVAAFDKANTENRVDNIGFRAAINSFNTYKDAIKTALNDFVDSDEAQGELLVYTHVIDSVIPDDVLKPDVTPEDAKAVYEEALDMLRRGELKDLQAVLDYVKEQILDPDAEITPEQEQQFTPEQAKEEILELGEDQAKKELVEILQMLVNAALTGPSDADYEFGKTEGNLLYAYRQIRNDETMKNGAILLGVDILNVATNGILGAVKNWAKDQDIKDPSSPMGLAFATYRDKVFGEDTKASVQAMHDFVNEVKKIIEGQLAQGQVTGKLKELNDLLLGRDLTIGDLFDMEESVIAAIDPTSVLQDIWFDLGLGRVIKTEDRIVKDADVSSYDAYDPMVTQAIDLKVEHRVIENWVKNQDHIDFIEDLLPAWFHIYIDGAAAPVVYDGGYYKTVTTTVEEYGLTLTQDDIEKDVFTLTYDSSKVPEGGVDLPIRIYRGPGVLASYTEDDQAANGEAERFVVETTVSLKHTEQPDKPEPPVPAKKIDITEPVAGTVYQRGETVTISGTSENFELIALYIRQPDGTRFLYDTITPSDFANGRVTYRIPDDAAAGTYTVIAGDNEKSDTTTFVVGEITEKIVLAAEGKDTNKNFTTNFANVSAKRGTAFANLPLPETIKLYTPEAEAVVDADITWSDEGYDSRNTSSTQTITGTYTVNSALYDVQAQELTVDGKTYPAIDYTVTIGVKLRSGGTGGTSSDYQLYANFTDAQMSFDPNTNILTIKGQTNINKLVVELVGPDGTTVLKSVDATLAELQGGFTMDLSDIAPLKPGKYTLNLRATGENGKIYDTFTFVIDPTKFMVEDHINYIMGYEDGTVHPDDNITRDEVAAILFRLLKDEYRTAWLTNSTTAFSDLPADAWAMTPIATMNTAGIINGYPDGTFGTDKAITRAEFAALCSRMGIEDLELSETDPYTDISDSWARQEIKLVTAKGWFQGDNGKFRPEDNLTRAEAIAVINRMLGRDKVTTDSFKGMTVTTFSDVAADAWYYVDIVEASNAHDQKIENGVEVWSATEKAADWTTFEK